MSRIGKAAVVLCASLVALAPSAPSPRFSATGRAATGLRVAPAMPQTRVLAPSARPPMITRPAPPLQHAETFNRHHHHHHDRGDRSFVFVEPPFFWSPFASAYGYPYSSSFYAFGSGPPAGYSAPSTMSTPFFCWVDQIGFTDEARFAHHLHEVHGVPLDEALKVSETIGERYVFFGY